MIDDYEYFDDTHPLHDDDGDDDDGRGDGKKGSKKRRKNKRDNSKAGGCNNILPALELCVTGTKCKIHRDDDMAEQMHKENHLIDYYGDYQGTRDTSFDDNKDCQFMIEVKNQNMPADQNENEKLETSSLLLDRYDVRTLLEDLQIVDEQNRDRSTDICDADLSEEERKLIYVERFGDMKLNEECNSNSKASIGGKNETTGKAESNAIGCNLKSVPVKFVDESEMSNIPDGIQAPNNKREYDIIKLTAGKVRERPLLEVLLKVKEAENPDFHFLEPQHPFNRFYRWLKTERQLVPLENVTDKSRRQESNCIELLDIYGSSSSEDEESDAKVQSANELGRGEKGVGPSILSHPTTIEEKRAKRLKLAKEHRDHYLKR